MQYNVLTAALTGMIALCMMGCAASRTVTSAEREYRTESGVFRDSVDVKSIEVRDTLKEVTTITVQTNDKGDTLKVVQVTDRTRARNRDGIAKQMTKVVVKTDTVYVERRDSVAVESRNYGAMETRKSNFVTSLKWVFWIVVALAGLVLIIKIRR